MLHVMMGEGVKKKLPYQKREAPWSPVADISLLLCCVDSDLPMQLCYGTKSLEEMRLQGHPDVSLIYSWDCSDDCDDG